MAVFKLSVFILFYFCVRVIFSTNTPSELAEQVVVLDRNQYHAVASN